MVDFDDYVGTPPREMPYVVRHRQLLFGRVLLLDDLTFSKVILLEACRHIACSRCAALIFSRDDAMP